MTTFTKHKPKLFRNSFIKNDDARGFLSIFDYSKLELNLNLEDFYFQLLSFTEHRNTFRGFHFQSEPYEQDKIISIHNGSIIDIIFPINLRTVEQIKIFKLRHGDVLYVPKGYAHGFLTKSDNVLIQYNMDNKFSAEHYKGIRGTNIISSFEKTFFASEKDKNLPHNSLLESLLNQKLSEWNEMKKS